MAMQPTVGYRKLFIQSAHYCRAKHKRCIHLSLSSLRANGFKIIGSSTAA